MVTESVAQESLSKQTVDYIRRYLIVHMGFGYWDNAEEAINEIIEHCRRQAHKYRGDNDAKLESFLVTVARRKALSMIEKRDRRRQIMTENWNTISRQPWIYGGHDAFSTEEVQIISTTFDEPVFGNFGL